MRSEIDAQAANTGSRQGERRTVDGESPATDYAALTFRFGTLALAAKLFRDLV